jgi:hypothetical protein
MGILAPVLMASLLANAPPAALAADECTDLQRPATFDKASAMLAVFCAYDRDHEGTLLPVEHTEDWALDEAETVASPIIAITYREGAVEKAVLAVQLQAIFDGDVSIAHAQTALISIYVFQRSGGRWAIEKRAEEAFDEGHNGEAPGVQLVKLGSERFGLWFSVGDVHQGYLSESAFIVTLSETRIREVVRLDMGGANAGACSDNPKERGDGIYACWSYEATPAFITTRSAEYYTLRISYAGTDAIEEDRNRIRKKNEAVCLTKGAGDYDEVVDPKCASYKPLPDGDVFLGDGAPRAKPPRRDR